MNTNQSITHQSMFPHKENQITIAEQQMNLIIKSKEPFIAIIDNVLSDDECQGLIDYSKGRLTRSKIGSSHEVHEIRTSSGMFFKENENDLIAKIESRLSSIVDIPLSHAEGLQVLQYTPGQEYKVHHDYFSVTSRNASNNRICTVIMYLNDVEEGGETYFPELNISISPQKGSALYFEYFYDDEKINESTLHGGAPVIKGTKWASTLWFRKQKIRHV